MRTLDEALMAHRLFAESGGSEGAMFGSTEFASTWDLRGASALRGMEVSGVDMSEVDLTGADLTDFSIDRGWMGSASLRNATAVRFFAKKVDLPGTDFSGADLSDAKMIRCDASGTAFVGARLDGSWLARMEFSRANFTRASVKGATLLDVLWDGADLTAADFSGTTGTVYATTETHPSWEGRDLLEALRARGADVTYVVL